MVGEGAGRPGSLCCLNAAFHSPSTNGGFMANPGSSSFIGGIPFSLYLLAFVSVLHFGNFTKVQAFLYDYILLWNLVMSDFDVTAMSPEGSDDS